MVRGRCAWLAGALLASCASPPAPPGGVLDPAASREDMGTLVDASDVLEVSAKLVASLRRHPEVAALLTRSRPVSIVVEPSEIKNLTSMTTFRKGLFVNHMLALLNRGAGEDFRFLDREAVAAERARRPGGQAAFPGGWEAPAGGELVLAGRILEKLDRRPAPGGEVEETRSVQFSFSLVRVRDAVVLWTDSFFRVKQQVLGTLYG